MDYVSIVLKDINGNFLLQLRENKSNVNYPGCWGFFGGEIDNESVLSAVSRELKEELNLDVDTKKLKILFNCESVVGEGVVFLYDEPIDIQNLVLNEGEDMKLFNLNELKQLTKVTPELKKFIELN